MKSYEFLSESKKKHKKSKVKSDDFDDEMDTIVDPDEDNIPHILMQLRKALDVDGNYKIKFQDGSKHDIPHKVSKYFVSKYLTLKPADREEMQKMASKDIDGFKKALHQTFSPLSEPSIYEK